MHLNSPLFGAAGYVSGCKALLARGWLQTGGVLSGVGGGGVHGDGYGRGRRHHRQNRLQQRNTPT